VVLRCDKRTTPIANAAHARDFFGKGENLNSVQREGKNQREDLPNIAATTQGACNVPDDATSLYSILTDSLWHSIPKGTLAKNSPGIALELSASPRNLSRSANLKSHAKIALPDSFGCRGVAQPGSAPALGAGGLEFESPRPDQILQRLNVVRCPAISLR
jgi:hypothetical protein